MRYIIALIISVLSVSMAAQVAITIPAEYEENNKLVFTWSYMPGIDSVICEITGVAQQVVEIDIIFNPDSTQFDTTDIKIFLSSMNADSNNVNFVAANSNTCWIRQYSPVIGYGVFVDDLVQYLGNPLFTSYNQSANDSIPKVLSTFWGMDIVDYGLEFENTNILYDGVENLFIGDHVIDQNIPMDENEVRFALNSYFNSDNVVFTPSLTHSGGGDIVGNSAYMKLLDFETIIVASIPDTLPDYAILENFVVELALIPNNFGGNYKIIRIPSPPNGDGKFPTTQDEEVRSYTNSLILNNIIFMPTYGIAEFDSTAYHIYKKYMSGYEIHMIDARLLSLNYGSINALTKEVPQSTFLRILHQKNRGPKSFFSDYEILCLAAAGDEIQEMWLYYKINGETSYTKTEIHLVCPQHVGIISGLLPTDTVNYYIEAISSTTTITYPLSAPQGNFTFWFDIVDIEQNRSNISEFSISPNPSSGNFKIDHSSGNAEIDISIYNIAGQLIISTKTYTGSTLNLSHELEEGYYNVIVNQDGKVAKLKLVIAN
ncbi:MAG: agmatine deiminase family protein [Bacteroidota bacterium]